MTTAMKIAKNKRDGKKYMIVDQDENVTIIAAMDGSDEKKITTGTFKRWYDVLNEEAQVQDEPIASEIKDDEPASDATQAEAQKPATESPASEKAEGASAKKSADEKAAKKAQKEAEKKAAAEKAAAEKKAAKEAKEAEKAKKKAEQAPALRGPRPVKEGVTEMVDEIISTVSKWDLFSTKDNKLYKALNVAGHTFGMIMNKKGKLVIYIHRGIDVGMKPGFTWEPDKNYNNDIRITSMDKAEVPAIVKALRMSYDRYLPKPAEPATDSQG